MILQTLKNHIMTVLSVTILAFVAFTVVAPAVHSDDSVTIRKNANCGVGNTATENIGLGGDNPPCDRTTGAESSISGVIRTVINVFSAIVGAISVIMIIIGGFRYVTSAGDSNNVSGAKNTILYAIVGLIIVAFAQVIVQFVLQRTA